MLSHKFKVKLIAFVLVIPLMLILTAFSPMEQSSHELSTAPMVLEGPRLEESGIVEAIDWEVVINALISPNAFGIPIIILVIGLTYALGEWFDIHGKWQFITAMVLGLGLGGGYQLVVAPLGYAWQSWFFYVVYGLIQGLIASMIYETAKDLIAKIMGKMLGNTSLGEG